MQDAQDAAAAMLEDAHQLLDMLRSGSAAAKDSQLTHLQRAQALQKLTAAAHAAYALWLRCTGLDPAKQQAVQQEAARLAVYSKKVDKAVAAEIVRNSRPALSLDVGAAGRFIEHAIPELSAQQRTALRTATTSLKRKADTLDEQRGVGRGSPRTAAGTPGRRSKASAAAGSAKDAAVSFLAVLAEERTAAAVGVAVPTTAHDPDVSGSEMDAAQPDG